MGRTVIAGGGINGLLIAALLAHGGQEVVVLERRNSVGGRAKILNRNGFTIDNGIHVVRFGPYSALARIFCHLGKTIEFFPIQESHLLDFDNQVKLFPTSPAGFLTTSLFSSPEKLYALYLAAKIKYSSNLEELMRKSVYQWMEKERIGGGIKRFFQLLAASMLVCPFHHKASAGELLINIQKVLKSGYSALYPRQGWSPLFEFLLQQIESNGKNYTRTKVDKVLVKDGKVRGVIANGREIAADTVIINLPINNLPSMANRQDISEVFLEKCSQVLPTSGISLDFCLDRQISQDQGWWYLYNLKAYGLFTSNLCPSLAPHGKQLFTLFKPISGQEINDKKIVKRQIGALKRTIFSLFPSFQDSIEWERAQVLPVVDGCEVNIFQTQYDRPGVRVPGAEGLFLCSDAVSAPGAGGDVGNEAVISCFRELTGQQL